MQQIRGDLDIFHSKAMLFHFAEISVNSTNPFLHPGMLRNYSHTQILLQDQIYVISALSQMYAFSSCILPSITVLTHNWRSLLIFSVIVTPLESPSLSLDAQGVQVIQGQ